MSGSLSQAVCWKVGGVPYDFPEMPIRIAEVTCITSIERVLGRFDDLGAGANSLAHHLINFFAARASCPIVNAVGLMGVLGRPQS